MTVTNRETLGDVILNGTWYVDVNTGTVETPTWTPVNGIYDFKDSLDSKSIDVSDFSSDGWADNQNVGKSWGLDFKVWRKRRAASVAYDPGQEFIRLQNGESIGVRFYEMSGDGTLTTGDPRTEAYSGTVSVKWSPDGGKFDDGRSVSVTLTGKGRRTSITHPDPNAA